MANRRTANIKRKTSETDIVTSLILDGDGKTDIKTGIAFLDHMLTLFTKHGLFDLKIRAKGDLNIDLHHTNEDIGITLGDAFKKALGDKKGIRRFGSADVPMDEALARIALDISGRPSLQFNVVISRGTPVSLKAKEGYSLNDAKQFLNAFVTNAGINLNINADGEDVHHISEAIFKALGKAMDEATQLDPRIKGIPSTKGRL